MRAHMRCDHLPDMRETRSLKNHNVPYIVLNIAGAKECVALCKDCYVALMSLKMVFTYRMKKGKIRKYRVMKAHESISARHFPKIRTDLIREGIDLIEEGVEKIP